MILESLFFLFGMNAWEQGLEKISAQTPQMEVSEVLEKWKFVPEISADAVVVMEKKSAQIVFEKNKNLPLPMASLTKMMTAIVIAESHDGEEWVEVSRTAAETEGSSMKLEFGDEISIENALSGLLMNSGNDAAIALALHHQNSVSDFVQEMNKKADQWKLKNTHFTNPHGFDAKNHYSSAFDLALIAKKLLNISELKKIVNTKEKTVFSKNGTEYALYNTNELLWSIFPVFGIKTGTTDDAGECLALEIKTSKHEYIVIILGSENRYQDAKTLLWKILLVQ